jgi:hypothetical protein
MTLDRDDREALARVAASVGLLLLIALLLAVLFLLLAVTAGLCVHVFRVVAGG